MDRSLGVLTPVAGTDQFSRATSPDGATTLTPQYDAAGNLALLTLANAGGPILQYAYTWDELGYLSSASRTDGSGGPAVTESYGYGAGGGRARITRTTADGVVHTVRVFDSLVLKDAPLLHDDSDYADTAATEELYLAGGMARVFQDPSGQMPEVSKKTYGAANVHTFLSFGDVLGSGAFVIDHDTGELAERTSYMAYGAIDADYRPKRWEHSREDQKFTGAWDGAEVGLVYMGARYYSPQLGRFISPDPLTVHALRGDVNPYEYAYGNPTSYVDPTGLDPAAPPEPPPPPPIDAACPAGATTCNQTTDNAGWATYFSNVPTNAGDQWQSIGDTWNSLALWLGQSPVFQTPTATSTGGGLYILGARLLHGMEVIKQNPRENLQNYLENVQIALTLLGAVRAGFPPLPGVPAIAGGGAGVAVALPAGPAVALPTEIPVAPPAFLTERKGDEWQPPDAAAGKVPSEWGPGSSTRKGVGTRWQDPTNAGNGIRIDRGNPANIQQTQQVDHVIVRYNGQVIGRSGQPIAGSIAEDATEAHIPLSEWLNWASWFHP